MLLNISKTRKSILLILFFSFYISAQAQYIKLDVPVVSQQWYPSYDYASDKYGFVDADGKMAISYRFDAVRMFDALYKSGPFYLNRENAYYQQEKQTYKKYVEETIIYLLYHAAVKINGAWGFVDLRTGQVSTFTYTYTNIDLVNDGTVFNKYSNDVFTVINNLFVYGVYNDSNMLICFSQETAQKMRNDDPYIQNLLILNQKQEQLSMESPMSESDASERCASERHSSTVSTVSNDNSTVTGASYNANVYDEKGNWYETGLIIESYDKVYIKMSEGQFELIKSENKTYQYKIKGKNLFVK